MEADSASFEEASDRLEDSSASFEDSSDRLEDSSDRLEAASDWREAASDRLEAASEQGESGRAETELDEPTRAAKPANATAGLPTTEVPQPNITRGVQPGRAATAAPSAIDSPLGSREPRAGGPWAAGASDEARSAQRNAVTWESAAWCATVREWGLRLAGSGSRTQDIAYGARGLHQMGGGIR